MPITLEHVRANRFLMTAYCHQELGIKTNYEMPDEGKEHAYETIEKWLKDTGVNSSFGLVFNDVNCGFDKEQLAKFENEEFKKADIDIVINELADEATNVLIKQIYQKDIIKIAKDDHFKYMEAFNIKSSGSLAFDADRTPFLSYAYIFKTGLENALTNMFGLVGAIPKVFKEQFHVDISPEQYETIANNNLNILNVWSGMLLEVFETMKHQLTFHVPKEGSPKRIVKIENFEILDIESKGGMNIAPKVKMIEDLVQLCKDMKFEHPVFGCPILRVKGPGGKPLLDEINDWVVKILNKFIVIKLKQ